MPACDVCGFDAKTPSGLVSHRRHKHADPVVQDGAGANLVAIRRTLVELDRLGRFEEVDAARRQALLSMAQALDENPFNSQMWREYRESLNEVLRADDDADDGLAAALAAIGSGPSLGDAEKA
jgi:hypothetical protein